MEKKSYVTANRPNWRDPRDRELENQDRGRGGFFDSEFGRRSFRHSSHSYNDDGWWRQKLTSNVCLTANLLKSGSIC